MRRKILPILLLLTVGCARLGPKSGYLIDTTTERVAVSETREKTMIRKWSQTRRDLADQWLRSTGIPNYIKRLVGSGKGKKRFKEKVCKAGGTDQAREIANFAEIIANRMEKMRRELFDPIDKKERQILSACNAHYAALNSGLDSLRKNIHSVLRVKKRQAGILNSLSGGKTQALIDKADVALDKLIPIKEVLFDD